MKPLTSTHKIKAKLGMIKGLKMMALAAVAVSGMNMMSSNVAEAQTEDLISFSNQNAQVAHVNGRYKIVDGNHWMMDFAGNRNEAYQALRVLKHYRINQLGYVGRPDPSMTYLLSNGRAPVGALPGEDAIAFNPDNLRVRLIHGRWKLMDGNHAVKDFGSKRIEAYKSLQIIRRYGFNRICFVGRPNPSLTYFRVEREQQQCDHGHQNGNCNGGNHGGGHGGGIVITFPGNDCNNGHQPPSNPGYQFNEDLVRFNADRTTLKKINGRWKIIDGNHAIMDFGSNFTEGLQALGVIKYYRANMRGFVGRPGPSMTYLLVDGHAPYGAMPGEDAISFNPHNLRIRQINGRWKLVDGNSYLMDFGDKRLEAIKARFIIRKHGFTKICYIGRPGPSMVYFRK